METVGNILTFIGSYPVWARLLLLTCFVVFVGTLVLAPRTTAASGPKVAAAISARKDDQVFMRIRPIKLYPDDPNAEVQLSAFVNGTEYVHPSVGGVQWMKVGPNMSEKIVPLPRADRYDVRFEMRIREGATLRQVEATSRPIEHAISQTIEPVMTLPYSGEYRLYQVNNNTRSAGVFAVVSYEIYSQ